MSDRPTPGHDLRMYEVPLSRLNELTEASRELVALRARSQGLEEALRPFADIFERYEQVHDLDANEVVVPYVALFNAHKQLEAAREALSLGLPDEEGEGQRQDSLTDQLHSVMQLARKHGCYDAIDWMVAQFESAYGPSEEGDG